MRARNFALVLVPFLVLIMSSVTNAGLDVDVSVKYSKISPFQNQVITATTNEGGKGILFVIQPVEGTPWIESLNDDPELKALWNRLPNSMQTAIANRTGGKLVSFNMVSIDSGGGSKTVTFPGDFTSNNGDPSTALSGKYKVVFAFVSRETSNSDSKYCCFFELDFDCKSWFVIPEVPFGTIVLALSMMAAIPAFALRKRITPDHKTT